VRGGAGFGGAAGAELEVAGVEEAAVLGLGEELGGAEDVAGGQERDAAAGRELVRAVEGQGEQLAARGLAGVHEARGALGAERETVARHVVEVRVGDEGARNGAGGIEPPVDLGQMEPLAELDIPRHLASKLARWSAVKRGTRDCGMQNEERGMKRGGRRGGGAHARPRTEPER
jgi:hypothetical protein